MIKVRGASYGIHSKILSTAPEFLLGDDSSWAPRYPKDGGWLLGNQPCDCFVYMWADKIKHLGCLGSTPFFCKVEAITIVGGSVGREPAERDGSVARDPSDQFQERRHTDRIDTLLCP